MPAKAHAPRSSKLQQSHGRAGYGACFDARQTMTNALPGLPSRSLSAHEGAAERVEPFASSFEHLRAELDLLDLRVRMQVFRARRALGDAAVHDLSVSEEDVDRILGRPAGQPSWASTPLSPALATVQAMVEQKATEIARRSAAGASPGVTLRLPALAARFGLSPFEVDVLLIALAPELDVRYDRLFVYLNDDVTKRRPTVDTALGLLCPTFDERLAARRWFAPEAALRRHGLMHLAADAQERQGSLLRSTLQPDPRIVEHLHDTDTIDPRIAPYSRWVEPGLGLGDLLLPGALKRGLTRFVLEHRRPGEPGPIVYLQGPYGAGKQATAEALCRELGTALLVVDGAALAAAGDEALRTAAPLLGREALLLDAAIHWEGAGALLTAEGDRVAARAAFLAAIEGHPGTTFLAGVEPWEPIGALAGRAFIRVELPRLGPVEQAELWTRTLAPGGREGAVGPEIDVELLTSKFRLNGGQIQDAAAAARDLALFRDGGGPVTMKDLGRACRLKSSRKLTSLARSIPAQHGWDDLVLPPERLEMLQEICLHVKHRSKVFGTWGFDRKLSLGKGLGALFTGLPGTGKTMAAAVIAGELGLELYQIDLSSVVNKYIGETEKHLGQLFDDAEANSAVLLFDEADAIFGKRTETKDAHDRYANLGTSYLLQRIDAYEGVVLLSSNLARNMDEAFMRRLQFIIDFPLPGFAERRRIWEGIWPADMPRDQELDLEFLAHRLDVAGGHIRNIAVASAFLAAEEEAPVGMRHVLHAARRELAKMGRMVSRETLAYPERR